MSFVYYTLTFKVHVIRVYKEIYKIIMKNYKNIVRLANEWSYIALRKKKEREKKCQRILKKLNSPI